ncbi:ankyrin repeat domain-containing protein 50 [Syngnathoides biaculeatus]|uniref:ankyrin repeat domain-containing protein 50 n=1 Tax=Syngnathoides biaculeatus TaxID=300417 RepID=UPI002ADDF304|nr:ankyrin repeat domain-containing protein 50 [Syngnathoides biaculeatus]XP_061697064.1 ankyrin repeat domain-containing protein 50 [Syngnathoides biaculeatus]XP_061697065.1 ankyrin repeat domain-containing protein 50 [Syngnathoides biaculeatus]XP_061697066.1 ankyrin repeat domain-containing protein 50 [Syngnathoides biaculeatus]XP_061697067.1 ankyrin repeat domain-containing protein 50 [Syngnathoides biaculeatus]XP_061697068.1 ankyrin repeat domain-containing protein 50 [Syngnathoides biacul
MSSPSLLRGRHFFCREWALDKLRRCLDARHMPGQPAGVLVTGGAGAGKTALCTEVVWPNSEAGQASGLGLRCLAWHFCGREEPASSLAWRCVMSLAEQLRASSLLPPEYCTDLSRHPPPDLLCCQTDPHLAFQRFVLKPLLDLAPPPHAMILLVDSLDISYQGSSGGTRNSQSIAELLAAYQNLMPTWILLVCSVRRHNKSVNKMFSGFHKLCLDDLRQPDPVHDVQQYILKRLDREAVLRRQITPDTADMLNLLHIKSSGCFLFLERVLDGVATSLVGLREIRDIPGTLNGLYLWLCQRLFPRRLFSYVKPLLNVILVATAPLTPQDLFTALWTHDKLLSIHEFQNKLRILAPLLIDGPGGTKLLFHSSFGEWLTDVKYCTQKYLCSQSEGHSMLAMSLTLRGPLLKSEEAVQLGMHLVCSDHHQDQPWILALWMIWADVPTVTWTDCSSLTTIMITQAPVSTHQKVLQLFKMTGLVSVDPSLGVQCTSGVANNEVFKLCASVNQLNSTDVPTLFVRAALEGSANLVQLLLTRGSEPLLSDNQGQTPLTLASRQGHFDVLKVLLDWVRIQDRQTATRMLEHADNDGWTALRSAAWGGHSEAVRLLLDAGADVDRCDREGRTALRAAAWGGHEETVLILLDYRAQVDKADCKGRTPLIAAAYMGHHEVVEVLLDHRAQVDLADRDGRTALSVAALCVPTAAGHQGYGEVASLLLERGANPGHRDHDGMTPLLLAAYEGHDDMVELLLDAGADVDETAGPVGDAPVATAVTPLLAAATMGHMNVVSRLLFWGAAVDAIDDEGRTALSLAAAQGSCEVVRALLERGLDENHKDDLGWTPLHAAACEGHRAVCAVLTERGSTARVGEMDVEGRTALILAAQEGHIGPARLLLDRRSPIDHRAYDGHSALCAALLEGHVEVAELLMRRGADTDVRDAEGRPLLYLLVLEGRIHMVKLLIEKGGPPLESRDSEGRTALHVASWQGNVDLVDLLLKHGANPNALDTEGRPPLHSVAWTGNANVGRHLLSVNGINVDHTCHQGATALSIASQQGNADVVSMLVEAGANPDHMDKYGRTPIKVAGKHGHAKVVQLLESFGAKSYQGLPRGSMVSPTNKMSLNIYRVERATSSSSPSSAGSTSDTPHSTHSSQTSSTGLSLATLQTVPADTLSFIQQIQQHSLPRSRSRPSTLPPPPGGSGSNRRHRPKGSPSPTLCTVTAVVHNYELPPKTLSHVMDYQDKMNLKNLERVDMDLRTSKTAHDPMSNIQGPQYREAWDPPTKHNAVLPSDALEISMLTSDPQLNLKHAIKLQFEGPTSTSFYKRETPL